MERKYCYFIDKYWELFQINGCNTQQLYHATVSMNF